MPRKHKRRQLPMFGEGQDFPLFSQTAPRAQDFGELSRAVEPFVPQEAPRQEYLPGTEPTWTELAQTQRPRPSNDDPPEQAGEPGDTSQPTLI